MKRPAGTGVLLLTAASVNARRSRDCKAGIQTLALPTSLTRRGDAYKIANDRGCGPAILPPHRNNSGCNDIGLKLEVTNLVGTVVTYLTNFWLSPGHIKLIDLANVGT